MRRLATLVASAAIVAMAATAAAAHAPTISITSPADGALVTKTAFPASVAVAGNVSHLNNTGSGQHNLCGVEDFKVVVSDGTTTWNIGSKDWEYNGDVANCPASENWAYNFTAPEPGEYTITASGKHRSDTASETSDFEAVLDSQTVIVSYPAAPAVAAGLLADSCTSARYGSGKAGGNHIADVAAEMNLTKGTHFRGVPKRDVEAYAAEVEDFLTSKPVPADLGAGCN